MLFGKPEYEKIIDARTKLMKAKKELDKANDALQIREQNCIKDLIKQGFTTKAIADKLQRPHHFIIQYVNPKSEPKQQPEKIILNPALKKVDMYLHDIKAEIKQGVQKDLPGHKPKPKKKKANRGMPKNFLGYTHTSKTKTKLKNLKMAEIHPVLKPGVGRPKEKSRLTIKEKWVLLGTIRGWKNHTIAKKLEINDHHVFNYRVRIKKKLGIPKGMRLKTYMNNLIKNSQINTMFENEL